MALQGGGVMGKRSSFERRPQDFYVTPYEAVVPLLPHLPARLVTYIEPCAGDGSLIDHLKRHDHVCVYASDIEPKRADIQRHDAFEIERSYADYFITNPPWTREILHPLIVHLSDIAPTWLLFDADWAFTKQSMPYMKRCRAIVAVGRVKWIPDSPHTGKDNAAWYLFTKDAAEPRAQFFERAA